MSGTKSPPRVNRQHCLKTPSTLRQTMKDFNNSKIYFIVGLFISHSHTSHCLLCFSLSILVTSTKQWCRDNDDSCCKHGMLENSDDSRLGVVKKTPAQGIAKPPVVTESGHASRHTTINMSQDIGDVLKTKTNFSPMNPRNDVSLQDEDFCFTDTSSESTPLSTSPDKGVPTSFSNLLANPYSKKRLCICDMDLRPDHCKDCKSSNRPCELHTPIQCKSPGCHKYFHKGCIAQDGFDNDDFICMECSTRVTEKCLPYSELKGRRDQKGKKRKKGNQDEVLRRLGLTYEGLSQPNSRIKSIEACLEDCNVCDVDELLNSTPRSYPCPFFMNNDTADKAVVYGRKFDISMLLFKSEMCDCCGRVHPCHCDPNMKSLKSTMPFPQKHLNMKYHDVWKCECTGFCNGCQFYANRPTNVQSFQDNHNGKHPSEFIGLDKKEFNSRICNKCHEYFKAKTGNSELGQV